MAELYLSAMYTKHANANYNGSPCTVWTSSTQNTITAKNNYRTRYYWNTIYTKIGNASQAIVDYGPSTNYTNPPQSVNFTLSAIGPVLSFTFANGAYTQTYNQSSPGSGYVRTYTAMSISHADASKYSNRQAVRIVNPAPQNKTHFTHMQKGRFLKGIYDYTEETDWWTRSFTDSL